MRVLYVVPNIVSYDFFVGDLCAAARAAGHDPHVACSMKGSFGSGHGADDRATIHALDFPRGMQPLDHLRAARELNALVERLKPDIVHAHFSAAMFTVAVAHRAHWPPTFGTFHGMSFPMMRGLKREILRFAESWAASRFDAVWVLTADDQKVLQEAAPAARVHVYDAPGIGCRLADFRPDRVPAPERAALRAELGIPTDAIVFVFVGRLVDFKGFGLTVRAFLGIAPENPRIRLLNVGPADPLHPSGLTPEEERARRECPQIIDVGMRQDVWRYLAISDVMAFPSQREGMPVCIMEALAMGIPVITADSRGCREVVRDGVDGLVLREPSVEAMREAMLKLARDGDCRARLGAAALAGRERFSRDAYVREQLEIHVQELSRSRSASGGEPVGMPVWKRAADLVLATGGLLMLAPLLVFVALLIAVKLGRPVLFRQKRPGRFGEPFTILKFRTMTDERDADGIFLSDEVRLTPFGKWLRSTSLDELPELWNVICGEMSLVGPRPLLLDYVAAYSPEQARRQDLPPGITGWTQVNGRNAQSWERKFALDTWYIDHVSPRLDLLILWKTIFGVLARHGIAAPDHMTSPHFMGSQAEEERQVEAEIALLAPPFARGKSPARTAPLTTSGFLLRMLTANAGFVLLAAVLGWWLRGDPTSLIGDNRPVSDFSALQLLVVAWLAGGIFSARRSDAPVPLWRQPRVVWLLISVGFCYLTADQLLDLHERTDSAIHAIFHLSETALSDRIDDFIVVSYGLIGLGVLFRYREELAKFAGILALLAIGFGFFGLSAACDMATNRNDFVAALFANPELGQWVYRIVSSMDQVFTLIAECFFAAGFFYVFRQARRAARRESQARIYVDDPNAPAESRRRRTPALAGQLGH